MPRCEVQWISQESNWQRTPDTNIATMMGRVKPFDYIRDDKSIYHSEASNWFFVCAEHAKQLITFSNWDSKPVIGEHDNSMAL